MYTGKFSWKKVIHKHTHVEPGPTPHVSVIHVVHGQNVCMHTCLRQSFFISPCFLVSLAGLFFLGDSVFVARAAAGAGDDSFEPMSISDGSSSSFPPPCSSSSTAAVFLLPLFFFLFLPSAATSSPTSSTSSPCKGLKLVKFGKKRVIKSMQYKIM